MKTNMLTWACAILTLAFGLLWVRPVHRLREVSAMLLIGRPKFEELRSSAHRHAAEFTASKGGSLLQWEDLVNGEPTVYVVLRLDKSYRVWPDGRIQDRRKDGK